MPVPPFSPADRSAAVTPVEGPTRLLGVWAHPDDEAYLSAGLMDRVVRAGGQVTLLVLTDGEGGFGADDPRPLAEKRGQRRRELQAAMARIGVHDVRYLGLPDGGVPDSSPDALVAAIAGAMHRVDPDVVVTFGPDGVTGHPDHVACWSATTRAWQATGRGELWYAAKTVAWLDEWRELHDRLGIWMTDEPTGVREDEVEQVVSLRGPALDRKRAVLAAHRSQTAAVAEAFGEDGYRRWIHEEAFRRPTPAELDPDAVLLGSAAP